MKKKTLEELAEAKYEDEVLRAAIIADAERAGTRKMIEAGKLVLPHPEDARRWLAAQTQPAQQPEEE